MHSYCKYLTFVEILVHRSSEPYTSIPICSSSSVISGYIPRPSVKYLVASGRTPVMINPTSIVLGLVAYVALRSACVSIYNLYYHPLAKFPGPKYAAATEWHKTYQEVICQRSWVSLLKELHARYGMMTACCWIHQVHSSPHCRLNLSRWSQ